VLLMPKEDDEAGLVELPVLLLSGFLYVVAGFLAAPLLLLGELFSVASRSRLLSESSLHCGNI
jgi:hypothetical protein